MDMSIQLSPSMLMFRKALCFLPHVQDIFTRGYVEEKGDIDIPPGSLDHGLILQRAA